MGTSCSLTPSVSRRNGVKIEEKDSKLFADIKEAVKDRETAWKMWAYTKTSDFKENYKNVEYDEWGEVTFPSLIKALELEGEYNSQKSAKEAARDYGFTDTVFENPGSAIDAINDFNSKEENLVALLQKKEDGYRVIVQQRTGTSLNEAGQQAYNHALTGEIIKFLQTLGFNVEFASNPDYNGLFDPENATLRDGLLNIISIARGELGEAALPEEFSHLIIEGLINHPLVQRLLNSLNDEQIREVLGDKYEEYAKKYNNDSLKMKKEAAGQMLAQYITAKGTINEKTIKPKRSLLSKIWKWVKELFSKVKDKQLYDIRERAYDSVAGIYDLIVSREAMPLIDKQSIVSAEKLYALKEELNTLEKLSYKGEAITARAAHHFDRNDNLKRATATKKTLQEIKDLNESDRHFDSVIRFLQDATGQMEIIASNVRKAKKNEDEGWFDDLKLINEAAKTAREIDTFVQGYQEIIDAIAAFNTLDDSDLATLGINADAAEKLALEAKKCREVLNSLTQWRRATALNILYHSSRTVLPYDIVRGIGSKRHQVMTLTEILHHADRDINFIDRWFTALSDADDPLLTVFDGLVKNQQYARDMEMQEWYAKIAVIDEKLRKSGHSSEFMYEKDKDGVPTEKIISIYDWEAFNEDRKSYQKWLAEKQEKEGRSEAWYSKKMDEWKRGIDPVTKKRRLIREYVDPEMDKLYREGGEVPDTALYDEVPNPDVYSSKIHTIENLSQAEKDYYNEMMAIKREMMTKIPKRGQGIYKTINISKEFVEGIIGNSMGNPVQATLEHYKKKFTRRPDEIGFGASDNFPQLIRDILKEEKDSEKAANKILNTLAESIDDDIRNAISPKAIKNIIDKHNRKVNSKELERDEALDMMRDKIIEAIASKNFYLIDTDFANHRIQKLPIYYSRPLKNKKMLSTDFSGAMVAYSAMAVNYEKMNEIVDILEVGRKYVKEDRGLHMTEGNKSVMSQRTVLGRAYKSYVETAKSKSNIVGRLDDYMDSVVYEERKDNEGTIELFGANLDIAKTLDTIKDYTGLIGLGFNLFSTISNIAVGKLQQWIEAFAGEYFTVKDYAKAVKQYGALIGGHLAEMASPVKKNKLSLLIQMFDPMGDYYENLRNPNFSKSTASRILGNGVLAYIGMNAGEHMLHCQTMLAILNNIKLIDLKTKKKISLYDALQVKERNGIHRLELAPNLAYERDLIDNTGNKESNKNYGKALKDEHGKIKTELVQISEEKEVKDMVHGSYSPTDKGAMEKDNILKQFRKFVIGRKKVVRKVNDSLNGAFSANDKGAAHKKAWMRMVMQFRQWMPAHYERRFARAHYDNDLERWREGYYVTVGKTLNQMRKEAKKAGIKALMYYKNLSEHERANLKRANAEIAEFLTLLTLIRLGGRVKDKDRNWIEKMVLYQINRMYLEVGSSMPSPGFFSNIIQLLQSPAPTVSTFEKFNKVLKFYNMFDEIQTGRYQGWTEWERDAFNMVPALGQISKAIAFDDSMFSMYEKDD